MTISSSITCDIYISLNQFAVFCDEMIGNAITDLPAQKLDNDGVVDIKDCTTTETTRWAISTLGCAHPISTSLIGMCTSACSLFSCLAYRQEYSWKCKTQKNLAMSDIQKLPTIRRTKIRCYTIIKRISLRSLARHLLFPTCAVSTVVLKAPISFHAAWLTALVAGKMVWKGKE